MVEVALRGLEEHWRERGISIPRCRCGYRMAAHFGRLGLPPYLYCRGQGRNCSDFITANNVPDLNQFLNDGVGGNEIHFAYRDGARRLRQSRVEGDIDIQVTIAILVSFLAGYRSQELTEECQE